MKHIEKKLRLPATGIQNPADRPIRKFGIPAACSLILFSIIFSGCFRHFYSTNSASQVDSATLVHLVGAQKYFILHDLDQKNVYALTKINVSGDSLHAELGEVPDEYATYQYPAGSNHNVYPVKDEAYVLYEVNLYTEFPVKDKVHTVIPLKNIRRIDVYELDKKSTNKSKVGSIVGITLTTAAVTGLIIAIASESNATKPAPAPSNTNSEITCSPLVYLKENNNSELQGTMYSGALYASLERTDWLPLAITRPVGNKVSLTMKGKPDEIILLNQVQLMQVTHHEKDKVLVDRKGQVTLYRNPEAPDHSENGSNEDVSNVMARDGKYYSFTNHTEGENSSDIVLNFKKPRGAATGKLIVNARNSAWSFYLFNQFKKLYGDYYPAMIMKKDKADPKKVLQCELDQYLPLMVSVKSGAGWKLIDYFPTPGTSGSRDLIMNLDLEEFKNSNRLELRLQTTYMFWDLDYIAMDFSTSDAGHTLIISANRLFKNKDGVDTQTMINENQGAEINRGERLNLEFNISSTPAEGFTNSYFLVGTGYYHDFTPFPGTPRFDELARFSGKGAFDKYSREKYDNLLNAMFDNGKNAMLTAK